jgi:hypothetical protein
MFHATFGLFDDWEGLVHAYGAVKNLLATAG